ncbi:hypothetical protein SAMN00120144_4083 [Hymenobacter roseosalivarius DSM 11622]|uniref:Uncharacterized protein n=1 Tax=Hymenobacter roseosalivarius DSM 11622 TaxID=645990 RepID=A0A1W1W5H2_9BACT|nr:hypothetical protein [Hymenobacter roseosalivarius]SMC00641.1 hypothetical protein SAMN00120144_4083 [Hymenobacter roseosalivarius DSM 11622]
MQYTHYSFRALPFADQLSAIWQEGTFLARRYEEEDAVNLYYFPNGFFVELYYDQLANALVRTRTFTSYSSLLDYAPGIELSTLGLPDQLY